MVNYNVLMCCLNLHASHEHYSRAYVVFQFVAKSKQTLQPSNVNACKFMQGSHYSNLAFFLLV